MRKLLAAVDFSPSSREALEVAIRIANERGAELVIAHAWYVPPIALGIEPLLFPSDVLQQMLDDVQHDLDAVVRDTRARVPATGRVLSGGPPWARIVDVVDADRAIEMIVVGTHGRTGIRRVLLGSVATQIVRHAPCSVLVVRAEDEPLPFTDVLVSVDFSVSSHIAIDEAASLVSPGGSGITLLHVIEAPVRASGEHFEREFLRSVDVHATARLDALAAELRSKVDVGVDTRIRLGYAGAQILAMLEDDPSFDLVIVGSHARHGLPRAVLGSVAEKVVRHAHCPVLVARKRVG